MICYCLERRWLSRFRVFRKKSRPIPCLSHCPFKYIDKKGKIRLRKKIDAHAERFPWLSEVNSGAQTNATKRQTNRYERRRAKKTQDSRESRLLKYREWRTFSTSHRCRSLSWPVGSRSDIQTSRHTTNCPPIETCFLE
jgi:hypothetical protein